MNLAKSGDWDLNHLEVSEEVRLFLPAAFCFRGLEFEELFEGDGVVEVVRLSESWREFALVDEGGADG